MLRISILALLFYGALIVLTYGVFQMAPTGFVPQQDQGRVMVSAQLPDSASLQCAQEAMAQIDKITREEKGVAHTTTICGMSFIQAANSSNFASMFAVLDPFEKRRSPALRDTAILARLRPKWFRQVKDAQVTAFPAAPIAGLSVAGGFKLMIEDRGGLGLAALQEQTDKLIQKLQKEPGLTGVSTQFRSNTPQLFLGYRPHKSGIAGRVAGRRESDAANVLRLVIRQ